MKLLFIFLCPLFLQAQVYDSAGYVKVRYKADTVKIVNTVIIRDTIVKNNTVIIHDTLRINNTLVIRDTVCPSSPVIDVPPADNSGYILVYQTGYDNSSDLLCCQIGKGIISTSVFKTGPGSFFSIPENVSSGIRSEVQYDGSKYNPDEGAIEYDVRYEVIIPNNGHSLQWHPYTSGGSASPGLWHIGGKFVIVNWYKGGNYEHPTGITIEKNKWYHIRMEYKFGSNGYFNLYIDGELNKGGSWTGQVGDNSGHYLKVGYNGWDSNSANSRIYYDNLKIYKKG